MQVNNNEIPQNTICIIDYIREEVGEFRFAGGVMAVTSEGDYVFHRLELFVYLSTEYRTSFCSS